MEVVFALTRHSYDSYSDYYNLVKNAWGKWCYIDEIKFVDKDKIFVISPINGELGDHLKNHIHEKQCKLVWWNLERPPRDENHDEHKKNVGELFKYIDYMIVSDKYLQEHYYACFGDRIIYTPIGYHECLCEFPFFAVRSKYSFSHISYVWGRRDILNNLPNCMPNSWGEQRKYDLLRTKFMVNIHQDQFKILEPLRFIIAVSHGLPIISETLHSPAPYIPNLHFLMVPYEHVVSKALSVNNDNYEHYSRIAQNAFEMMKTKYPFAKNIEEMAKYIK